MIVNILTPIEIDSSSTAWIEHNKKEYLDTENYK